MQRDGNDQHLARRLGGQLRDRIGQLFPTHAPPDAAGRTSTRGRTPSFVPDKPRRPRRAQNPEAPGGIHGKVRNAKSRHGNGDQECHRNGRTQAVQEGNSVQQRSQIGAGERCGRGEPQSEQKQGRRAQPRHPWDFGGRGRLRASGKSPMVERRTSVNRSPCGRRTSCRQARHAIPPRI